MLIFVLIMLIVATLLTAIYFIDALTEDEPGHAFIAFVLLICFVLATVFQSLHL